MRDRRKHNIALLKAYFKKQQSVIVANTQKRIVKGVFWISGLSLSYYIAHKMYSQKLEVQQMEKKLTKLYPKIVTKVNTIEDNEIYYVKPEYEDQLANIVEICWKYHYKIIINSSKVDNENIVEEIQSLMKDIPEKVKQKCLIINLSKMNEIEVDEVNGSVRVQSGMTCKQLNEQLNNLGYQNIFPKEIAINQNQTIYDAVCNNYPTNQGPLSKKVLNLDIISSQGQFYRSSNQNSDYGATPNLNSIFVGTGGIFGIPIRTNFKLQRKKQSQKSKILRLQCTDLNQNIETTRKIQQFLQKYNELLSLQIKNADSNAIQLLARNKINSSIVFDDLIKELTFEIPDLKQTSQSSIQQNFNIFFNSNQRAFENFLIFKNNNVLEPLQYSFCDNLLKIHCNKESLILDIISDISSENGVLIWSQNKQFIRSIKKTIDEAQVGSGLMKILVQIRQGIDHKKIYYNHNRYEDYFSKGTFRKLTQIFW